MKSAYELAMERLNKSSPTVKLTDAQKREIADLEARYKAKLAERELAVKDEMNAAAGKWDLDAMSQAEDRLALERKKLQAELEEKKEAVRNRKAK
jgi:hypothetical protein